MSEGAQPIAMALQPWRLTPTARNRLANYINFAVTALMGLVISPILLGALGAAGFGTWKAAQKLFETALATQGGATQALKWTLARGHGRAPGGALRRQVGAAIASWALWTLPFGIVALGLVLLLPTIFPEGGSDLTIAGTLLAVNGLLAGILGIPASALIGINKGYLTLGLSSAVAAVTGAGLVWAALSGFGVAGMAATVLACSVLGAGVCWHFARQSIAWWGVATPRAIDRANMGRLGGWTLGWSAVEKILLASDLVLIAALAGAATAGQYVFTAYAAQTALIVCLLTTNAAMPTLGAMLAAGDGAGATRLIARSRRASLTLALGIGAAIVLCNGAFVALWAGEAMYLGSPTSVLIVLASVQLAHIRTEAQILDTMLAVRPRVMLGILAVAGGIFLAILAYRASGEVTALIAGLMAGRLVLTFGLPGIVAQRTR